MLRRSIGWIRDFVARSCLFQRPGRVQVKLRRAHGDLFCRAEGLANYSKRLISCGVLGSITAEDDLVFIFFMTRAHTTYCAALQLLKNGFAIDAVMQHRSLVEGLITLRFIVARPGMARRYVMFGEVIRMKTLRRVAQLGEAFAEIKASWEAHRDEIEAGYEKFLEAFDKDFTVTKWAGRRYSVKEMAEETASSELYNAFYGAYSQVVHGTVDTSRYSVDIRGNGIPVFRPGPGTANVERNLKALITIFGLYWDEVSLRQGAPSPEELRQRVSSEWFEYFSRRDWS